MRDYFLLLTVLSGACGSSPTGMRLDIEYSPPLPIKYLLFQVLDATHLPLIQPTLRAISNPDHSTVDFVMNQHLAGSIVSIRVDALDIDHALLGTGQAQARIVAKSMIGATILIEAPIICGDGVVVTPLEACDDGNTVAGDGCSATCQIESGAACAGMPSRCSLHCGDGVRGGSEACDDGNTVAGDGCSATCQIENGWSCTGDGTCTLPHCGDGVLDAGEACDDGNVAPGDGCGATCQTEAGFTCAGAPSVCQKCGNGTVEGTEVCDGGGSATCWSLGFRKGSGAGTATCAADCSGYTTSACGVAINSEANIKAAISEAYQSTQHEVVSIQPGDYADMSAAITLDECGGTCSGTPHGITLRPLLGAVTFSYTSTGSAKDVFDVASGGNTITGFTLRNGVVSIALQSGAKAGSNVIRGNRFLRDLAVSGSAFVHSQSDGNQIVANQFVNTDASLATGIFVDSGQANTVAMNVVAGAFSDAMKVQGTIAGQRTFVDQNSIELTGSATGQNGIRLGSAADLCIRNNLIAGNGFSTGYILSAIAFASDVQCGVSAIEKNDVFNHLGNCAPGGTDCTTYCAGAGPLCDLSTDPGFTDNNLCLAKPNALIDAGLNLGYDLVDDNPDLLKFTGTAPDVGARESGTTRSYGGLASSCP